MVNYKLPAEAIHFIIADSQSRFVLGDDTRLQLGPDNVTKLSFDTEFEALLDEGGICPLCP